MKLISYDIPPVSVILFFFRFVFDKEQLVSRTEDGLTLTLRVIGS